MLCLFNKINTEWICSQCGRRVKFKDSDSAFAPSAKCRIPDSFIKNREQNLTDDFYYQKYNGVGYFLLDILNKLGTNYTEKCGCKSKTDILNRNGIEWCEKNIDTILKWMENEAKEKNLTFSKKAAIAILRLCIRKSKVDRSQSL